MTANRRVIIVGAGMGGLTLGVALVQRGFEVTIYEQAAKLGELGAGLTVTPSGMRVFNALGLWEPVRDLTVRSTGMTFVHYQTGAVLDGRADWEWTRKPDAVDQGGQLHRAMLHALLVEAFETAAPGRLVLGRRLTRVTQDEAGVSAEFEGGDAARGDLLICCDGWRSAGYRSVFGSDNPARFTGVVAIRCLIPRERAEPYLSGGRSMKYVGPGRGFSRYGIKQGALINCIALATTESWTEEGWSHPCSRAELLELYRDFHPDVIGLIENAPEGDIFKWALYDREPLPTWTKGRVTLLGDAAHPMLPYMAQGATAAFEDAYMLARALSDYPDHREAFARYEAARLPRTAAQMRASRDQGVAVNQADPNQYARRPGDFVGMAAYDAVTAPL